ncbi:MAG: hypothetical protein JW395_3539 [Nitrospira sp.]|nr:hypothetical protein [Nitrospira sp.]
MKRLVANPEVASNITAANIFRLIASEEQKPTLILDEADTYMEQDEAMRGIVNSGHTRDFAVVRRIDKDTFKSEKFSTWAPMAIAKIGELSPTLESRSIIVRMRRAAPNQRLERFRTEDDGRLVELGTQIGTWARTNVAALRLADPEMPEGLGSRDSDNWRPLIALADLAGGEWPHTARQAAVRLSKRFEDPNLGIQLLADIRLAFERTTEDRYSSAKLCAFLNDLEDRPWCEFNGRALSQNQLARQLRPFGVRPGGLRSGDSTPKGYMRCDFEDLFDTYVRD